MSADPECKRCGRRGFGNCPEQPYMQANVGGHGWRRVPYRVRDCIRHEKGQDELGQLIKDAYQRHRRKKARDAGVRDPEFYQGHIEPECLV